MNEVYVGAVVSGFGFVVYRDLLCVLCDVGLLSISGRLICAL